MYIPDNKYKLHFYIFAAASDTLLTINTSNKRLITLLFHVPHTSGTITVRACTRYMFKKNLNASRPSAHPPVRGGNVKTIRWDHIGCKDKTSSWHLNRFPDGGNIELTIFVPFSLFSRPRARLTTV